MLAVALLKSKDEEVKKSSQTSKDSLRQELAGVKVPNKIGEAVQNLEPKQCLLLRQLCFKAKEMFNNRNQLDAGNPSLDVLAEGLGPMLDKLYRPTCPPRAARKCHDYNFGTGPSRPHNKTQLNWNASQQHLGSISVHR